MAEVASQITFQQDLHVAEPRSWLGRYWFSQDHKVIAIQYGVTAIIVGLFAVGLSGLIRLQLGFPDAFEFIAPDDYYQFVTVHGMIMIVYLLTALLLGGFGNYLIPLMLGARDMVFPYLNMLSYHMYLLSVVLLFASYVVPGGPTGAGWTMYPPAAVTEGTPGSGAGILMMLASLAVFVVAFTMGGLNYVTTILQARTSGMTLMRMPLTVWTILLATILGLFAFPALFVAGTMMALDAVLGTSFFMPLTKDHAGGGSPLLFQHLFWFFGHPEVYIVALPTFGIISDVLSVHARRPIFGYRMMVWATLAIGVLSFLVWAHHMYVSGMHPYFGYFFAVSTLVIAVPTALKVYNWTLTLWRGSIRFTLPMLFSIGFLVNFLVGGLSGLFLGNVVVDVPRSDTYFVVAHFHMVMGVAPVLAIMAGIYHWYPLITGRHLHTGLGHVHFWITFLGTYAIFFPMHFLGLLGVPRRYYAYAYEFIPESVATFNQWVSVLAIMVACAQLVFVWNLAWSRRRGRPSEPNPWHATTLEWQTPEVPPLHGNWGERLPVVQRWAYDYSVPGTEEDFIPQTIGR